MEKMLYVLKGTGKVFLKCVQYGCIFHCVKTYCFSIVACSGKSMEPTVFDGDVFLVEPISVRRQTLKRGDLVGARAKDRVAFNLCKRIVAMEGDKVYYDKKKKYIWVPRGHVWLEGDNKDNSQDSRDFGPVPYGLIRWKLAFRVWTSHKHKLHMANDTSSSDDK